MGSPGECKNCRVPLLAAFINSVRVCACVCVRVFACVSMYVSQGLFVCLYTSGHRSEDVYFSL